jgi:peptidoglycan L-alanyl-D-glutamate endopeptidase CwlK
MTFKFSRRSLNNLVGVHPDLVRLMTATLAVSPVDFGIIEGVRSPAKQHADFLAGASDLDEPPQPGKLRGRHLTGRAIDFAVWKDNAFTWDDTLIREVVDAAKSCAKDLGIAIVCGADWTHRHDAGHIELDRAIYPDELLIA